MDRASVFGTDGWGFESLRARLTVDDDSAIRADGAPSEGGGGRGADPARAPAREAASDPVIAAVEDALRATPDDALARAVERLSDLYTTGRGSLAHAQADAAHLAAKREYFLASDAPKVGLALDECVARSEAFERLVGQPLVRIVDLGAGVGATSVGFLAWLARHGLARSGAQTGTPPRVAFHAVELGAPAARAYGEAVAAAARAAGIACEVEVVARDFREAALPACDLVLCQTALNELLVGEAHEAETIALVARWARHAPLVLIEPALRPTTRALMALRDALVAEGAAQVVAPCPQHGPLQGPCPMRERAGDWCHEARPIARTPRVLAIDRLVGRRDGRALFSFLATVPPDAPGPRAWPANAVRLVTDALGSRGKTERLVCRTDGAMRTMRLLDREVREGNRAFLDAPRGATVVVEPLPANDRIAPEVLVAVAENPPGATSDR